MRIPLPLARSPRSTRSPSAASTTSPASPSAFALDIDDGVVSKARIGLGGVAATPIRARDTEAALEGRPWSRETVERGRADPRRRGHAARRPPRQRGLPRGDAATEPAQAACREPGRRWWERERTFRAAGEPVGRRSRSRTRAPRCTSPAPRSTPTISSSARKDVLHAYPVQVPHAHARVTALRTEPALAVPGVVRVLTAADVPGVNDAGVKHDEPLFPDEIMFFGHAVCWVLGETIEAARLGAAAVEVDVEPLPSYITVTEAIAAESFQGAAPQLRRGDVDAGLDDVGARVQRRVRVRRPGALLPRDACGARLRRRGRADLRPEQHAAPVRDAGDRGARARPAQPRGHRAVPAHGRRLRRQGDAAARLRGDRRARRDAHRPARCGCG